MRSRAGRCPGVQRGSTGALFQMSGIRGEQPSVEWEHWADPSCCLPWVGDSGLGMFPDPLGDPASWEGSTGITQHPQSSPGHPLHLSTVRADSRLIFFSFQQLVSLSHHPLAAAVSGDTKQPLLAAGSGWGGLQVFQEALAWGCCQSCLLARVLCCLQNTKTTALLCSALRAGKDSALSLTGSRPRVGKLQSWSTRGSYSSE